MNLTLSFLEQRKRVGRVNRIEHHLKSWEQSSSRALCRSIEDSRIRVVELISSYLSPEYMGNGFNKVFFFFFLIPQQTMRPECPSVI